MTEELTEEQLREKAKKYAKETQKEFAAKMKELGVLQTSSGGMRSSLSNGQRTISKTALEKMKPEQVTGWLHNPINFEEQLRGLSSMLYNVSGEYKTMVKYFVDMARFYYVFEFSGDKDNHAPNKLKSELKLLSSEFSKMNISHEMAKVFETAMKEDVFYGYEISDKHSFFIEKLNPDYCRLSGHSDGMWTFQFDFSYFKGSREILLDSYPAEFRSKYNAYTKDKSDYRWQSLDFSKSVCFKFNETQREIVPPLSTTFEGLMELNDYRKYKKIGTKLNNYLILHQKVPMFDDTDKTYQQNNFSIDSATMMMFHSMLDDSLPEEIGAVVSPMPIEPLQLEKKHDPNDKVAEATRDVYNAAGVNQYLFNPDKNSTAGLSKSIQKDEAIVIRFYLQVARWLNRKITLNHPKWSHWDVKLLGTTYMSENEYSNFLIQLGTLGFPVIGAIGAMVGYDINKIESMTYLENDVLGLKESMVPLASSHTGGNEADSEGGRPESDDDKISDSGQANRDSNDGVKGGEK